MVTRAGAIENSTSPERRGFGQSRRAKPGRSAKPTKPKFSNPLKIKLSAMGRSLQGWGSAGFCRLPYFVVYRQTTPRGHLLVRGAVRSSAGRNCANRNRREWRRLSPALTAVVYQEECPAQWLMCPSVSPAGIGIDNQYLSIAPD